MMMKVLHECVAATSPLFFKTEQEAKAAVEAFYDEFKIGQGSTRLDAFIE